MSIYALVVLCFQACLFQNAYSQYFGPVGRPTTAPGFPVPRYPEYIVPAYATPCTSGLAAPVEFAPAAYGGEGIGDIAIAGRMPVAGTTSVAGQVPILGSVRFGGDVAARGAVTIAGGCGRRFY